MVGEDGANIVWARPSNSTIYLPGDWAITWRWDPEIL
jgi:hypothetical protein